MSSGNIYATKLNKVRTCQNKYMYKDMFFASKKESKFMYNDT
jgi:hypothetical protein